MISTLRPAKFMVRLRNRQRRDRKVRPAPSRGRPALGQAEQITARIVDAAWAVLLESGPELFALDRVASAAHASKQTIYARFAGKPELLEAVLSARTGLLFADFEEAAQSGPIETVITEVTRRSVNSLSAPEALMLERLIDWIDRARPHGNLREAVYLDMLERLSGCLERAIAQGQLTIADPGTAARFWLDGLIGHVRGLSRHDETLAQWPEIYARYFLRAIT